MDDGQRKINFISGRRERERAERINIIYGHSREQKGFFVFRDNDNISTWMIIRDILSSTPVDFIH